MVTYAKSKNRVKKPIPHASFTNEIGKMRKEFDEAMADGVVLDERKEWLVKYLFLVSEWRLEKRAAEKSRLKHEIGHFQEEGHKLKFNSDQISALAWIVTEAAADYKLELLHAKLSDKISDSFKDYLKKVKIGKKQAREIQKKAQKRKD
jgi:hypothetical protein